jgi:tetratricopeptide (TPR) repeat protein
MTLPAHSCNPAFGSVLEGKETAVYDFPVLRMKMRAAISLCPAILVGALLPGCAYVKHVPPGQSLSEALARRPQLVALPTPTPGPELAANAAPPGANTEIPLPQTEKVADAFTLGNLCLQQGRYSDAINAYEAALKDDPSFAEAWNNLAIAYQDSGQDEKAMAAFKKYKTVAMH